MATISAALTIATAQHMAGRLDLAEEIYRRVLALEPDNAVANNGLGAVLFRCGRPDEAMACYRRAVQSTPDYAEAYSNLGYALVEQERLDEAVACYQRAIQINPRLAETHSNLGNALKAQGKLDAAIACHRRALDLKPDYAEACNNLGSAWKDCGRLEEAIACYRRALALKPSLAPARGNLLLALHYCDGVTLAELAQAHAEYERQHAFALCAAWRPHENLRDPDRPLRLGFVSPDFGKHPVGYFLVRALENLDGRQCAVVCYSDRTVSDEMTARFKAAATLWRDVFGLSNEQLSEQIRADRIDILLDLAGHTARNRLLALARKPAPIQVSWIGYEGTTGLGAIEYLLADQHLVPGHAEPYYTEKVLRMPDGYVCFDPPADVPAVGPLPALKSGQITLAGFHNPAKLTPTVVATWARILRRLPQSRLILKFRGLDNGAARSRLAQLFATEAIVAERVEMSGWSPRPEYLGCYGNVDIMLDPFPFNGGATTCEALWMGVPVITCPGETFASRHSLSHLSTVGLTETIARDLDEYVELAVKLANDLPRLAQFRAGLRDQVARSPLCDGKRFAEDLLVLLRGVWREWCTRP